MNHKNKAANIDSQINGNFQTSLKHKTKDRSTFKPATQKERVLLALLHQNSLNCQEAEKHPVRARHLNSVISELTHYDLVQIHREREKSKGYLGEPCYLIRYSICVNQLAQAQQLVDQWRKKRNATQIEWQRFRAIPLETLLKAF